MSGKILIADDLSLSRTILRAKLAAFCYDTIAADNGKQAIAAARTECPDLILLDYHMPDLDGIAACKALRADIRTRDIPIILYSANADRDHCLAALKAGANDFLAKPLDEAFLMSRIRSLLRAASLAKPRQVQSCHPRLNSFAEDMSGYQPQGRLALLHRSHEDESNCFGAALRSLSGYDSRYMSVESALSMREDASNPEIFLLTQDVIAQRGLSIISELKARKATKDSMICALLSASQMEQAPVALDLGADEVVSLPLDTEELNLRLDMMLARKRKAEQMRALFDMELDLAIRDPLTGLFNRRYISSVLQQMMTPDQKQDAKDFAILMIDLDHFKTVNDRFGHIAGDEVLIEVSNRMRAVTRHDDILSRYGGEEFLMVMQDATLEDAQKAAARICKALSNRPIVLTGHDAVLRVSASVGIALAKPDPAGKAGKTIAQYIDAADLAMRQAKSDGRDRVAVGSALALSTQYKTLGNTRLKQNY